MRSRVPGRFECELLAFLSQHDGLTVREIYEGFGKPRGFVRGTIVKAMDRLLKKGLVQREEAGDAFVYRTLLRGEDLDRQLVESFVHERLGGRLAPLASFLADARDLDPDELQRLRELLSRQEP